MNENFSAGDEIIVCLYDTEYHHGLAALANSLAKCSFKGIIYVAYKDNLPPWTSQLSAIETGSYYLTDDIIIKFEHIETELHLAYYKPYFIRQTFTKFPLTTKLYYFDVDIVVSAPWIFFSNWLNDEVCLCLDSTYEFVHSNHPWRKDWKKLANVENAGFNPINFYVNSGFIGIKMNNIKLIDKWIEIIESYNKWGGNLKTIDQDGHNSYKGDQDLLNAAITVCPEIGLSIIGREGMGFTHPAYLMTHAIANIKPWRKNYLASLIVMGQKPNLAEKNFFNFCESPINVFSKPDYFLRKSNLLLSKFLGRFIGY